METIAAVAAGYFNDSSVVAAPNLLDQDKVQPQTTMKCTDVDCFDCNICLELAADPVVTLCGHLYCWPCIHKWLQLGCAAAASSQYHRCPVCKSTLTKKALVPLYGRGLTKGPQLIRDKVDVPRRPNIERLDDGSIGSPPHRRYRHGGSYDDNYTQSASSSQLVERRSCHSTAGLLLCGVGMAILPSWASGDHGYYYSSGRHRQTVRERTRRQEVRVVGWLHQMWMFLLCCSILCILLF